MLVAIGPPFDATSERYELLSRVAGLVVYDLRTRLRAQGWGVVRALADAADAERLAQSLRDAGFRAVVLDSAVAQDPTRVALPLRSLLCRSDGMTLEFRDGSVSFPYESLLTIVRGELRSGDGHRESERLWPTGGSHGDLAVARDVSPLTAFDAVAVADLHFSSVLWIARIEVKSFDFSAFGYNNGTVEALEALVSHLAERAGVRVDRSSRTSSLVSHVRSGTLRSSTPPPAPAREVAGFGLPSTVRDEPSSSRPPPSSALRHSKPPTSDPRFDGYSRLVAEAEREMVRLAAPELGTRSQQSR
ncbi:MAG: hypothetical protein JW940_01130 [Polyangiaceae bacterium]|nr:hypothetical protein [Polyangiaceae bacterium]